MFAKWGLFGSVFNVRDRVDEITFIVSVEMSGLTPEVRNAADDNVWAFYVVQTIRQEFPEMLPMCENARYVQIMVNYAKKHRAFADAWFTPDYLAGRYSSRSVELYRRRQLVMSSETHEYDRIMAKAWKVALARFAGFARQERFVENVRNRMLEYQSRDFGGDVAEFVLMRYRTN